MSGHLHGPRALALIAAFKFVKSALLVALGVGLFELRHPDAIARFGAWLGTLPIAAGHELVDRAIGRLLGMNSHEITVFDGIAFAYAALYAVEGFGLWRNARWAEYLTAIATSLFVPVELWEVIARFTPIRLVALAINVAIVVYLVFLLRNGRRRSRSGANSTTPVSP
jgi:uncharacterized membrane protein (DUF2068 family)